MRGVDQAYQSEDLVMLDNELPVAGSRRCFEALLVRAEDDDVLCLVRDITSLSGERRKNTGNSPAA